MLAFVGYKIMMKTEGFVMLDRETIINLKNVNISKDAEKTKERVRTAWMGLSKDRREEILALANLSKITVERAYKNGTASVKLVTALSQVLSVNPYYLTGQADEPEPYDESQIIQLITELGYGSLFKTSGVRNKRQSAKKTENPSQDRTGVIDESEMQPTAEDIPDKAVEAQNSGANNMDETQSGGANNIDAVPEAMLIAPVGFEKYLNTLPGSISAEQIIKVDELSEDDLILLLKSQLIKSKMSEEKSNHFTLIKYLLLQ